MATWMTTYTGKKFDLLEPRDSDIVFADIAHGLVHTGRYGGQAPKFWSVANHSILCKDIAQEFETDDKSWLVELGCLMHDAAEAYIGDVVTPIKKNTFVVLPTVRSFINMENEMLSQIFRALNMDMLEDPHVNKRVDFYDRVALMAEHALLFGKEWLSMLPDRITADVSAQVLTIALSLADHAMHVDYQDFDEAESRFTAEVSEYYNIDNKKITCYTPKMGDAGYVYFLKGTKVEYEGRSAVVYATAHQSAKVHIRYDDSKQFDYVPYHKLTVTQEQGT